MQTQDPEKVECCGDHGVWGHPKARVKNRVRGDLVTFPATCLDPRTGHTVPTFSGMNDQTFQRRPVSFRWREVAAARPRITRPFFSGGMQDPDTRGQQRASL